LSAFAQALLHDWGADMVNALLADRGYGAELVLTVSRIDSKGAECSVREGDLLATPAGEVLHDHAAFRAALATARDAEQREFDVHVLRAGEVLHLVVDPLRVSLRVEPMWRVCARKPR